MQGVAKLERGEGHVGLLDVAEPEVMPGYVLIEVKAAGLCGTDIHIYHDEYPTKPPVIMGHEVAGTVVEVGENVASCQTGDRVTSETYFYVCGQCQFCRDGYVNLCLQRLSIGSGVHGAFAQYVLVPEQNIHHLPPSIDEMTGALTEPLACCVHALERTRVEPGEIVVVSGPGAIGLLMMQVVKAAGVTIVLLGTNSDESRLALGQELGADVIINVQAQDARATIDEMTNGLGADAVFECSGAAPSARNCLELVRRQGRYAQVGLFGKPIQWDQDEICYKEVQISGSFATVPSSWRKALSLLANGQVQTRPLITHTWAIAEWQQAFDTFERREGLKNVLVPNG
ncbi:MAG: zinc-binding dehydrogenase [Chloroflexota bacterium]